MSVFSSFLSSSTLDAAVEIAPMGISIATLGWRGGDAVVQSFASAPVPAGAITPALTATNIADHAAVVEALRAACDRAGQRPKRVALVIPDMAARVALVRFDQIPARREDLDQLVRWQVRKSLPFTVEDACLTHTAGARSGTGGEFLVVAARRDTIREYESVCEELGMHAGLVDLSTLSVVNGYVAGRTAPAGDWLLVHMRLDYTSIVILRGQDVIFFRSRAEGDEEALGDVVHQTVMYYQDRLNGPGFSRAIVGGVARDAATVDVVRRDLEARLARAVEPLDVTGSVPLADRIAVPAQERAALAPLVGMLLRTAREAVRA